MPPPGNETPLFGGKPVAELREAVLADIRERASHLDADSPEDIPQEMFLAGVLHRHTLSIPTFYFDRVYSRDVDIAGTRYLEIHVPMVGEPQNLHLAPSGADLADVVAEAYEYEVVDGDLCFYIELDRNRPYEIDVLTDNLLASAEERYERLRGELKSLREEAYETAIEAYREETGSGRGEPYVL